MTNPNAIPVHTQQISVGDILDAMERNGYPQIDNFFVKYEDGKVLGACAIGQAGLNLNILPIEVYMFLNKAYNDEEFNTDLGDLIAADNDNLVFPVDEVARNWRNKLIAMGADLNKSQEFAVFDNGIVPTGRGTLV